MTTDWQDGYGQGIFKDSLSWLRFQRFKQQNISFRQPDDLAKHIWHRSQIRNQKDESFTLANFADFVEGCAEVTFDQQQIYMLLGARMWHGWPDPPEFCLFAFTKSQEEMMPLLEQDTILWQKKDIFIGQDFDNLPKNWQIAPS